MFNISTIYRWCNCKPAYVLGFFMVNVKQGGSKTHDLGRVGKIEITHLPSFDVKFTNIEMFLSFE